MSKITTLVFDLGGVLVDLNDPLKTFGYGGTEEEFWQAWLASRAVRAYERGELSTELFAKSIVAELDLDCTSDEFQQRFLNWVKLPAPEVIHYLHSLKPDYKLGLLSNTSSSHWTQVRQIKGFAEIFSQVFLSFRTGILKPDTAAFTQLPQKMYCALEEICYFDDNQINVDGAIAAGITACRTKGFQQLQQAVTDLQLSKAKAGEDDLVFEMR